jgi:glycerol-3-phosphate acyltransferase PlsY
MRFWIPLLAYLVGSIPFSFIVGRLLGGSDVRIEGSGNVGATNVLREAGPKAGVLALILDLLKGVVPLMLGKIAGATPTTLAIIAIAVVLGHIYPVFLGFRGGKGVATAAGVGLCLAPLWTGIALVIFGLVVAVTRFVSAGSIAAAIALPVLAHFGSRFEAPAAVGLESQLALAVIALMVVARHRANLSRLFSGTESKLGRKRS